VTGGAADNVQVASVAVSVDSGPYQPAQGSSSWSYSLNTSTLSNAQHTLTARATDTAGNVSMTSETINVSNPLPPEVVEQLVTPEGLTIQIYSGTSGWSAQQIYALLKPSAYQLSLIGPDLTIKVQSQSPSQTASSAGFSSGLYTSFRATICLQVLSGTNTTFTLKPDYVLAHEYGHAWTTYHLMLTQQDSWTPYLTERGLLENPLLDSSYIWSRNEMLADDYRMLFGDAAAQSEAAYINPNIADPRTVPGLREWFISSWAGA